MLEGSLRSHSADAPFSIRLAQPIEESDDVNLYGPKPTLITGLSIAGRQRVPLWHVRRHRRSSRQSVHP